MRCRRSAPRGSLCVAGVGRVLERAGGTGPAARRGVASVVVCRHRRRGSWRQHRPGGDRGDLREVHEPSRVDASQRGQGRRMSGCPLPSARASACTSACVSQLGNGWMTDNPHGNGQLSSRKTCTLSCGPKRAPARSSILGKGPTDSWRLARDMSAPGGTKGGVETAAAGRRSTDSTQEPRAHGGREWLRELQAGRRPWEGRV